MGTEGGTEGHWGRTEVERVLAAPDGCVPDFQPVVALSTGQTVGYEALARFTRIPRGAPEVWLARVRECGLGDELEAKAITAALAPEGRPLYAHLAVNVSPAGLESDVVMAALPDRLDDLVIE